MGDISEMRAIIVILAFIVFTVTLIGLMVGESPTIFIGTVQGSSGTNTSQSTSPSNLIAWNETYVQPLNFSDTVDFPLGGWNIELTRYPYISGIVMYTYDSWWIFNWNYEQFKWYNSNNIEVTTNYNPTGQGNFQILSLNTLDSEYSSSNKTTYQAKNSRTKFDIFFSWNKTAYATPSDAYNHDGLVMVFSINFNDRNTSINAFSFIAGIFTFSLPGLPFIPNLILWLMIFPAAMYLAFIFVLRIVGAVFGGGGA
jgi:hypothetical protein